MASIGDLVANLRANSAPLSAGLAAAQSSVGKFASFTRNVLAPVAGAFAGAFAVGHLLAAAGERGKAEKLLASQVAATGESAGLTTMQMIEYAESLQKTTGFSAAATEGAEKLLTTFRNVKGDQFKGAIVQAQNLSTVLGIDLTSATRLVGRALNDPVNSLKLLRKAGVQFTADQVKQIQTMQAAGDMAGAQKVILDQLGGSFGGAAANMASPMAMLRNTIDDIAAALGGVLGPTLKVISQGITAMIGPLSDSRGALQALGKYIAQFVGAVFLPFGQAIGQIAQLLMGMFAGGSVTAADFGNVAKLAMDNMTLGMIKLLPNGEQIFTNLGVTINAVWEGIAASAGALWEDIKNGFSGVANFVTSRAKGIWEAVKAAAHGENPIEAYNTAVDAALKQQIPAGAYQGPIDAFWKAFDDASANATQGLADQGGLKKVLTVDRDKLKQDVKSTIDSLPKLPGITVPDFKKQKPGEFGQGGGKDKQQKEAKSHQDDKLEAFEANSKEALQALASASRGDQDDLAERTASATERTADASERSADAAEEDDYDDPAGLGTGS